MLSYEAEQYGPDSTLAASIPSRPEEPGKRWWSWEPRWSLDQENAPISLDDQPDLFVLRSPDIDGLVSEYEGGDNLVEFERETTWASNLEGVSNAQLWHSEVSALSRYVDLLVEFRLEVVEQVLREHEVLGHVSEFGVGGARLPELNEEQHMFLRAAHTAIRSVESDVARNAVKAATWDAVKKQITTSDRAWGPSRIERVAAELGAFEKHVGSARPTDVQVRDRYERFRRRIGALAISEAARRRGAPPNTRK